MANYGRTRREFISAAGAAHSNSTTEAISGQVTIPANTLVAGDRIRVKAFGTCTTTNSTDTLASVLYIEGLAGTALVSNAATDVADDDMYAFDAWLYIDSTGASGTWHCDATGFLDTTPATVRTVTVGGAIDTTVDTVICVGLDWSVASSANSAYTVECAALIFRSME